MNASVLKKYLTDFNKLKGNGDKWIDAVPREIHSVFFDNPYVDALHQINDLTLKLMFGELYDDIIWFLYEWDPKHGKITMANGVEYNIKNIDDYVLYLINEGLVEV